MQKVEMFKTADGSIFETETEALKHEKRVEFTELYEADGDGGVFGTGLHGFVYADDLILWAVENPNAFRALVDAVATSKQ